MRTFLFLLFLITPTLANALIITVDKGEYLLRVYDSSGPLLTEVPILTQRVIIGRVDRPTPTMTDHITHIVFNPDWTVPSTIVQQDLIPKIKKDRSVIKRNGYVFYETWRKEKQVDPNSINWSRYDKSTKFPYVIVQPAGPQNALGSIKFFMKNKHSIYIHGTPTSYLFDVQDRRISSGCIRVEDEVALAQMLLPKLDVERIMGQINGHEIWIPLSEPVTVHITR